jgi:DNA-binding protein HU-beta
MNKADLIEAISSGADISKKDAEAALNAFTNTVGDALAKGDSVPLLGFGTFSVRERSARTGRNPATGAPLEIAASKNAVFKQGKGLKDKLN